MRNKEMAKLLFDDVRNVVYLPTVKMIICIPSSIVEITTLLCKRNTTEQEKIYGAT